ncbi:MAG TPA: fluoride efflux transporter CrcB [Thermoleophilaceae bacterium]|nr:fluoride efflux transporter CrcB [Thermoleophilaceae bacterium]
MTLLALAGAGLLGGLGSVARVLLDDAVMARARAAFPVGILAVNVSGSLALGLLAGAGTHGDAFRIVGVGLLGGYTTYSAWMLDTDRLAGDGLRARAVANVALSLVLGLLAVWLGRQAGGLL